MYYIPTPKEQKSAIDTALILIRKSSRKEGTLQSSKWYYICSIHVNISFSVFFFLIQLIQSYSTEQLVEYFTFTFYVSRFNVIIWLHILARTLNFKDKPFTKIWMTRSSSINQKYLLNIRPGYQTDTLMNAKRVV